MAGKVHEVDDSTFHAAVLEAPDLVVVDFWAAWCGPCRALAPVIQQLAEEYISGVKFVKVNADKNPQLSQAYRIQGLPTLLFFRSGQRVGELMGLQPKEAIARKIQQLQPGAGPTGASVVLTCPSCGQKNRTPASRESEAVCGKCHARLSGRAAST